MGESAGGASVAYLISSIKARGLFSRAISMSGSSTAQWSSNTRGLERARDLAKRLSCPQEETEKMIRCLKYERSLDQIILAQNELRLQNFAEMKSLGSESAPCPDQNFRPARLDSLNINYILDPEFCLQVKLGHLQPCPHPRDQRPGRGHPLCCPRCQKFLPESCQRQENLSARILLSSVSGGFPQTATSSWLEG